MRTTLIAAALALLPVGAAQATQIVNEDATGYEVTIITPQGQNVIEVAADTVLEEVCPEGCTLVLSADNEVVAGADESVRISNGRMGLIQD